MAKSRPRKQSLLQKTLLDKKVLSHEVFMYERLMEIMRDETTFEEILKVIITSVTMGLGFDRAAIFLANWDREVVEQVMGIDRYGKFEKRVVEFPLFRGKLGHTYSDIINGFNKGSFTNNFRRKFSKAEWEKNWKKSDPDFFCNATVPITAGSKNIIGVLAADNLFTRRRLKKADLLTLTNFATQAGLAIESFRLHEQIRTLTFKDPLTGVYNRRYFDNYLPREVQRCRRYTKHLSLIYVDLDSFKDINDTYGHLAGDMLLKHVAQILSQGLRSVDIVARMDGDEFAVILPEVGEEGAMAVADRIFKSITGSPSPVAAMREKDEKIRLCVGVACCNETLKDYQILMKLADESLYHAKTRGRNRVGDLVPVEHLDAPYYARPSNLSEVSTFYPTGG